MVLDYRPKCWSRSATAPSHRHGPACPNHPGVYFAPPANFTLDRLAAAGERCSRSAFPNPSDGSYAARGRATAWAGASGGFFFLVRLLARILAFGFGIAIDQFNDRHRRVIAIAKTRFDDAGIAAGAIGIAFG